MDLWGNQRALLRRLADLGATARRGRGARSVPSNSSGFMHREKGEGKGTMVRPAPRDGTGRDGGCLKHFWDKVTTMGRLYISIIHGTLGRPSQKNRVQDFSQVQTLPCSQFHFCNVTGINTDLYKEVAGKAVSSSTAFPARNSPALDEGAHRGPRDGVNSLGHSI